MKKNKNLFINKFNFKYFIIAFSSFILILTVVSVFLFMRSVDFNLNNIVDAPEENTVSQPDTEAETKVYSVDKLNGNSSFLFICTDSQDNLEFVFTLAADFDNKMMTVKTLDKNEKAIYDGEVMSCSDVYKMASAEGLRDSLGNASKYVKLSDSQLKEILSLVDNISINVIEQVDYHSEKFMLELDAGKQILSADYIQKLLFVSENYNRSLIVCDIINSVMTPHNAENFDRLFKGFINNCETDISVIDYSNSADKLFVYSNSADKFLASAVK